MCWCAFALIIFFSRIKSTFKLSPVQINSVFQSIFHFYKFIQYRSSFWIFVGSNCRSFISELIWKKISYALSFIDDDSSYSMHNLFSVGKKNFLPKKTVFFTYNNIRRQYTHTLTKKIRMALSPWHKNQFKCSINIVHLQYIIYDISIGYHFSTLILSESGNKLKP